MFKFSAALAASAAVLLAATAPAFADTKLVPPPGPIVADVSRDVEAISGGRQSEAKIINSVPAEIPAFETIAGLGGTATIQIDLDAAGKVRKSTVSSSSGHPQLDRSALNAVRASTYQAAIVNGHAVGGTYFVEVVLDR